MKHSTSGNTVLHLACSRGYYDVCKYLLQQYSKPTNENEATDKNANDVITTTGGAERIVNEYNYDAKTPIILAAEKGMHCLLDLDVLNTTLYIKTYFS